MGIKGEFVVAGAYKYSRNPQYVAYIVLFAGYAILCNSALTFVAVVILIVLSYLAPFREEPRLKERFGSDYDDYFERVPRFIPIGGRNQGHAA
jgi:protein-S-isoprenylcysteine O-methyltransferase Ste14